MASIFLPQEKRPYVQAIYAFSRVADDFADEPSLPSEERLRRLDDWDQQLQRCYEGSADHPIFVALAETVRRLEIPVDPLHDLLTAFKRDVTQNRYETYDDLLSYCRCSANPVGRLVLMIFGYREESLFQLSDHICTALQLTNFWQDVAVDRSKDRLYIPLEDLHEFGYSVEGWNGGLIDERFRSLMKFEVERARNLFYQGAGLPSRVNRELQLELKLVWFGGMAILRKIEKRKYDVWTLRPSLSRADKFRILLRGLFFDNLPRYGRKPEPWDLT